MNSIKGELLQIMIHHICYKLFISMNLLSVNLTIEFLEENQVYRKKYTLELISAKKVPPHEIYSQNSTRRAPPGARTLDTLIKSQVLYQLS